MEILYALLGIVVYIKIGSLVTLILDLNETIDIFTWPIALLSLMLSRKEI